MAQFRVYLKRVNSKGEAPVYISLYLNREKVEIPAKISLPPKFFDEKNGVIKPSYEYAKDKNLIISNIKSSINDILVRYRLRNEKLSIETFWIEYRNPGKYKNFFDFCSCYQQLRFQEVTPATRKKHLSCINNLRKYKEIVYIDDLNQDFFRKYVLYLRNRCGQAEITINKNITILSVYLNDAVKKGILKENPTHGLKLRGCRETTAEALDEQELEALADLYIAGSLPENYQHVLEFFLFMCFSSLHIGDAKALTIEQIGDNEFWYMRAKMLNIRPRVVRIPLSAPLWKIIDKQKRGRKEGVLWDNIISVQKVNQYLKKIAEAACIEKKLSAKVGRHTFATFYLRKTKDMNALKELMGHTSIKQTLVYAHVLDQDKKEGIQVFNDFKL
ncbi:MAG: site-specific integrase [Tannerellaceae bacterium]|jgi:site-specific recombinase XerD|nr:site-specific integrase [Tannerellaceae bacterium]